VSAYNSTKAFAPWVQRVPENDGILDKVRWRVFPGNKNHATVFCQGQEQYEMVRAQLAEANILLVAHYENDWSLTVKKEDLKTRFPNLFESRNP